MTVTVTVTITFVTMSCLIALVVDDTTFDMVLRGVFWPHAAVLPQSGFFQVLSVSHAAAMLAPYIVWGMCLRVTFWVCSPQLRSRNAACY